MHPSRLLHTLLLAASCAVLLSCGGSDDGTAPEDEGSLSGKVREADNTPVGGARVTVGARQTTSASDGSFELTGLPVGQAQLEVTATDFEPFAQQISVRAGENHRDVVLRRLRATVSGQVRNERTDEPISGAQVSIAGIGATSAADGTFELEEVPVGARVVRATADLFDDFAEPLTVTTGGTQVDVLMSEQELFAYAVQSDSFAAFVPQEVEAFRGVLLLLAGQGGNTLYDVRRTPPPGLSPEAVEGFLEHTLKYRQFAQSHGFALLGEDFVDQDPGVAITRIAGAMDQLAVVTGHAELEEAPILLFGYSLGGCTAHRYASFAASRAIGFTSQKGGCHTTGDAGPGKSVPGYLFIGETDTDQRRDNITTTFLDNRALGAPWALAVDPGAGHERVRDIDLILEWFGSVVSQRLPANPPPGPVTLNPVDETSGWLGDRATFAIASWDCYPGQRGEASWLPTMADAMRWQAFVSEGGVTNVTSC